MTLSFVNGVEAHTSTQKIHISAYVPPRCEIALTETKIVDGQLFVKTIERCNTQKNLKITENKSSITYERQHSSNSDQTTFIANASESGNSSYFLVVEAK